MSFSQILKSALRSLWANKTRSILTMLGIIIGISSVASLMATGEGVRVDITQQVKGLGSNLLVIFPGKFESGSGGGGQVNPSTMIGGNILTKKDVQTIKNNQYIENAAPMMIVSALPKYQDKIDNSAMVAGSDPEIQYVMTGFGIEKGRFLTDQDKTKKVIVLGGQVAKNLFDDQDPVGKKIQVNGAEFEVIGTLEYKESSDLLGGNELQSICVIPFQIATELVGATQIHRIVAKVYNIDEISAAKDELYQAILDNHAGNDDFSVLTQEDLLDFMGDILKILTALVTAIAAISLIVGGIGIMNIMLVSVTERTREIGLRKAVGATWTNIMKQFLVEAVVLSLLGGLIGLLATYGVTNIIAFKTALTPSITWQALTIAIGVSIGVGVIFGIAPAIRAARKDPIEALRYE